MSSTDTQWEYNGDNTDEPMTTLDQLQASRHAYAVATKERDQALADRDRWKALAEGAEARAQAAKAELDRTVAWLPEPAVERDEVDAIVGP